MTAGRDVATAEVADHANAGQFGKQGGIADLQRVAVLGAVADGLPVAANGMDFRICQVRRAEQGIDCRSIEPCQPIAGQLCQMQLVMAGLVQGQQAFFSALSKGA